MGSFWSLSVLFIILLNLYLACAYKVCHTVQQQLFLKQVDLKRNQRQVTGNKQSYSVSHF